MHKVSIKFVYVTNPNSEIKLYTPPTDIAI